MLLTTRVFQHNKSQDDVQRGAHVQDRWCVLGHYIEHDAQVSTRRTWLYGENSRRDALVLNFAAGNQSFPPALPCAHAFDGALAFYPGATALRALIVTQAQPQALLALPAPQPIVSALDTYAHALAKAPWAVRWPLRLAGVRIQLGANHATHVVDASGAALPLAKQFAHAWHWLAASGGEPVAVCGEWDGYSFMPLTLATGGRIYELVRGEHPRLALMTDHAADHPSA